MNNHVMLVMFAPIHSVNGMLFVLSAWNICCGVYAQKGGSCPAMRKHQRQRWVDKVNRAV